MNRPTIPPSRTGANLPSLIPHLVCAGAAQALDFYRTAFGAEEVSRMPGPDGRLLHALLRIGDSPLMLVDEFPERGAAGGNLGPHRLGGSPVTLHCYVPDVDAALHRAVAAGARLTLPAADMFWGDRYGRVEDPFGHQWSLATPLARGEG